MSGARVVGLDIGTTHLRAVEVDPGRGRGLPTVTKVAELPLFAGAVQDGEVAEPQTVSTAIKQLWSSARMSTKKVVVGIGNQRVVVRNLEMPVMSRQEIRNALPYQIGDLMPVAVEDMLLDYLPTGTRETSNGDVFSGLLVAATKDTVSANVRAVTGAGLAVDVVDLNALALTRALARGQLQSETVALVDIGARVTTVVIVAKGQPRLVRLIAAGGNDATATIADTLGISHEQAEAVKWRIGVGQTTDPELGAAAQAAANVSRTLIESIRNTFVYYASSNPGAAATSVVLSGGAAVTPGLGQYLSSASRLPVVLGTPFAGLSVAKGSGLDPAMMERSSSFAIALGLALGVAA